MKSQLLNQPIEDVINENRLMKQILSVSICIVFVLIICLFTALETIKDLEALVK